MTRQPSDYSSWVSSWITAGAGAESVPGVASTRVVRGFPVGCLEPNRYDALDGVDWRQHERSPPDGQKVVAVCSFGASLL